MKIKNGFYLFLVIDHRKDKKMKRKIVSVILAATMLLSMAGCGTAATATLNNENPAASEAVGIESVSETTSETAGEATSEESMELTMYFPVSVGGGPDALIGVPYLLWMRLQI